MTNSGIVPLTLTLRYSHPLSDLAPYFRGLDQGQAIGTCCRACGRTWFPPKLSCPRHGGSLDWVELSGFGQIVSLTETSTTLPFGDIRADRVFALIAIEGAVNLMFGRLSPGETPPKAGACVRLTRAPGNWPHPAQAAWFELVKEP